MEFNHPIKLENYEFITETVFFNFENVIKHDNSWQKYTEHQNSLIDRDHPDADDQYEDVEENHFYNVFLEEAILGVCLDRRLNRRIAKGIVNMQTSCEKAEYDERFVPSYRYEFAVNSWNSHSYYVEMNLPNPALDYKLYKKVRKKMLELLVEVGEENNVIITIPKKPEFK